MKWISVFTVQDVVLFSRRIGWSSIALFFLAGLISAVTEPYHIIFTGAVVLFLIVISLILLAISAIMPGILIVLGVPWLARAWLRGMNPVAISSTPWDQLSIWQKFLTYFWALTITGFTLVAIIGLVILPAIRK